ncbi:hypothetical protein G9A89_018653 [Geosiphon pyriformis]|nr:hypothetical protein G9A89_018653 [Geosiphon pyriformis]
MGDYSYLPQQSEEHFKVHNKNDLYFNELNPLPSCLICFLIEEKSTETYTAYTTYYFDQAYFEDDFEERNNSINQLLYSATFEQQPPDFEYLNHQIHIWIAAHQATETPFETKKESYQTAPVFDLLSSKSDSSTQTEEETIPHYHYLEGTHKIQLNSWMILRELPQPTSSSTTWFSQETDANAQHRIIRWTPNNAGEKNTSFTTWFEAKFRTPILISKWCMELERRTQGPEEVVTEYAKAIRKLIKRVDSRRNWTEEQKIHFFTKG